MDFASLKAPFPPDRISWRVGSTTANKDRGMALAYIDARDVQDRLDAVCGPAGWQCRYHLLGVTTVCEIGLRDSDGWVWKSDGAGATDFEGEKGALSDAFKRAAVKWGIGRYLYDVDAPWVAIEGAGKSFRIKPEELPKLRAILAGVKPEPAQQAQPAKAASELTPEQRRARAREWAGRAMVRLRGIDHSDDLAAWEKTNSPHLELCRLADKDEYQSVKDVMADTYARLSSLNGG